MENIKIDIKELESFLDYLQDKVEECYKRETQKAINEYIKEVKGLE